MLAVILAAALSSPNIVLISVDTLRPDHLGFYGHPFSTSPHLDRLAANALVFDDMICEVPLTGPSLCAMMTSRFPRSTGVTRNGIRLPHDVPTVAELLSAAGYETMCVTSNWTLKSRLSGLDRGFEKYDDEFRKKRWVMLKDERDAGEVTDLAVAQLAAHTAGRPFFAWFHYSDPHAPYRLHESFQVSVEADYEGDPGAKEKVRYDSEIAYADAEIQRLIEVLPAENTVIVFIGDHGESLREHGYLGHGRRVYQSGLRIPFFIHGPGVAPGRNNAPARGIDLAPTLLGLAGLEAGPGMQGATLTRALPAADRVRVVETYGGAVLNVPGAKEWMTKAGPELQCAVRGGWKLIREGGRTELYYLPDDPREEHNLAGKAPDRLASLELSITGWTASIVSGKSIDANLSAEDVDALNSLGYVK
jgi:arylsulfatase A-like enzyme